MADEVQRIPEMSRIVKQTDSNELLASTLTNQHLAQFIAKLAADHPMGSMHFHLITEAANRLRSQS